MGKAKGIRPEALRSKSGKPDCWVQLSEIVAAYKRNYFYTCMLQLHCTEYREKLQRILFCVCVAQTLVENKNPQEDQKKIRR